MNDVGERPLTRFIGTKWRGPTQDLGWLHDLSWRKDLLLPIVVGIVQLGAAYGAQHHHHPQTPLGIGDWALLVVGPLALVARRRHPVGVMWVTFLATLGPSASRFANLSLIVSFFVAATSGHRRAAWAVIVIGYVGSLWLAPLVWDESVATLDGALLLGAWLAVLVVVAEVVRMRREHVVEARVARQADVRHRASEERIRMARDLHDVIGHNISLINVQAGVGLDLMDSQPDQARAALAAIKTVSKEAIEELRTMLNALRQDDEDAPRACSGARSSTRARRPHPGCRSRGHHADKRSSRCCPDGRGPRRLPYRPGVAHQRGPPCRAGHHHGAAHLRGQPLGHRGCQQRVRSDPRRSGWGERRYVEERERDRRHARTGCCPRWKPPCRPPPRGRVPGHGPPSLRGGHMIRVLLADDQALVRGGFKALLDARDDIEVVGEATDGSEAVALTTTLLPDVVLMDIRMPGLDGLEATRQITADPRLADVRIVILTTFELDEYLFDALRHGASGFLVKDTEPADLVTAVRVVAKGDSLISPSMTRRLIAEFADRAKEPRPTAELDVLTDREREVMALVAGGLTNDVIAERLFVSPATARTHVSRAMTKLGARDRTQLVVLAYETGLVRPGWLA